MSFSRKECDDIGHKLGELAEFYNAKPAPGATKLWLQALHGQTCPHVLGAFDEHLKTGKHYPRPVEILEIIGAVKAAERARQPRPADPCKGNPELARAWLTYFRECLRFPYGPGDNVPSMPTAEALEIVNRHAASENRPDAIEPQFKIPEYWPDTS